jgi:conjugative transposon TraM protein
MKENEKKVSVLFEEGDQSRLSNRADDKKSSAEKLKKPLIFLLMGIVFLGCMYLIFKPSFDKNKIQNIGLNDSVPQASEEGLQADKQTAYEQEMQEEKEQEKRRTLTTLADYWHEDSNSNEGEQGLYDEEQQSNGHDGKPARSGNPALSSYQKTQSELSSFYQDDNNETQQLRKELEDMKEKLAQKEVPAVITADDQLALMEKSYQMAAKYLPPAVNTGATVSNNVTGAASAIEQKQHFAAFTPIKKSPISALYRELSDSVFFDNWSKNRSVNFYTAGTAQKAIQPKNSIKACVQQTQTLIGESEVRLRLLEPAQSSNLTIPQGTILTATGKFQSGRLQLKVASIEVDGNIIAVDITIYDLDGQQGLIVPYSAEMNALSEMAGNMSQQSGTSLMLTQSAGQQIAAEMSKGVVQGISGYFSKKARTPKVTLKAGHQVFLVSKK